MSVKIWVQWNDPIFVWAGPEDFLWNEAYRIVHEVIGAVGDWYVPRKWDDLRKRIEPELAEKFLEVVVRVNGLKREFKRPLQSKPHVTVDQIQKTFQEFVGKTIKVKAEIKK
jgi:hypothetical protein